MLPGMTPATVESPADEYDRFCDERRAGVRRAVGRCLKVWAWSHVAAVVVAVALWTYLVMFVAFRPVTPPHVTAGFWAIAALAVPTGLCALAAAARAGVLGLRHWGGLSGLWRAAALVPWLVTSAEALWMFMVW